MSTSDDEAPEEIALSIGKSQAATLRTQEQAQQKQQSAQRKRKRSDTGYPHESVQQTETSDASGVHSDEAQLDCVPDEVIEAVTAADKAGAKGQAPDITDTWQQPAKQPELWKRQQLSRRRAGPVTVQVLNSTHRTAAPSESALQFAQKQLVASKRRSIEMLRPCQNWSGKHSNTAHHSGPAISFIKNRA